jgi:uncharacterized protein with von Willebrand factor type A (vWA) domain
VKEILGRGVAGGTTFDPVILKALSLLSEMPDADLLLITDGAGNVDQKTINAVKKSQKIKGTRLFTFLVGAGHVSVVEAISDEVLHIDQMTPEQITSSAIFGR